MKRVYTCREREGGLEAQHLEVGLRPASGGRMNDQFPLARFRLVRLEREWRLLPLATIASLRQLGDIYGETRAVFAGQSREDALGTLAQLLGFSLALGLL